MNSVGRLRVTSAAVIRALERTVDPLFRHARIQLD